MSDPSANRKPRNLTRSRIAGPIFMAQSGRKPATPATSATPAAPATPYERRLRKIRAAKLNPSIFQGSNSILPAPDTQISARCATTFASWLAFMIKLWQARTLSCKIPARYPIRKRSQRRSSLGTGRGAACKPLGEISLDRVRDGVSRTRPPTFGHQLFQITCIRHVAEFDQYRGHIRCLENPEARRPLRVFMQARGSAHFVHHVAGKTGRKRSRLALREIDKNIRNIVGFGAKIDAGDDVRPVLGVGQPLRLR